MELKKILIIFEIKIKNLRFIRNYDRQNLKTLLKGTFLYTYIFFVFSMEKNAFDCAGIRAQVFRLPVDCSNPLSYTGVQKQKFQTTN